MSTSSEEKPLSNGVTPTLVLMSISPDHVQLSFVTSGNADLDIEQPDSLLAYLRQVGCLGPAARPQVHKLAGGVSSRTMKVVRPSGEGWVLKQSLPKLRVSAEWFSDPRRIHIEAAALRWLAVLTPPGAVPEILFEDLGQHILALQAVPEPHVNWKTALLHGRLNQAHVQAFGSLLGAIHKNAYLRREEIAPDFVGKDFFDSLRVEPFYRYTAEQVPAAREFLTALINDMSARRLTLVHGDYSPKNILIHQDQFVLLDPEAAHVGDPAYDVGFSLTHLLSKANYLVAHRPAFIQAALTHWQTYRQTIADLPWAADLEPHVVRHTLGCLLARVAGRSPLEYLNAAQRHAQQSAVLCLMQHSPAGVAELVAQFASWL